jgi:hypothetical protein
MARRAPNDPFAGLKAALKRMPVSLANDVAQASAPGLTQRTANAYDGGRTVYGEARPAGVNGPLTLEETGATRSHVRFVANGRVVRCVLPTPYAKYLVGKYKILPNGAMPAEWSQFLAGLVREANTQKYLRVGP